MSQNIEFDDNNEPIRLDKWFKQHRPDIPFGLLQKLIRKKAIKVNGKKTSIAFLLKPGDILTLPLLEEKTVHSQGLKLTIPVDPKLVNAFPDWILFENDDVVIINKPFGLATQGGTKVKDSLDRLFPALTAKGFPLLRLVHRLDKDTTGVLALAKSQESAKTLTQSFKERGIDKTYWAVVVGHPHSSSGKIELPLGKMTGVVKEKMSSKSDVAKPALTEYKIVKPLDEHFTWLELKPHTGRKHQLRAHCAESGFPILGDGKYGGKPAQPFNKRVKLHLHAREISIPEMDIKVEAPLPEHFKMK